MELHYRGAIYNHTDAPVEMTDNCVISHYRGVAAKICQPKQVPTQRSTVAMKYRGAWVR